MKSSIRKTDEVVTNIGDGIEAFINGNVYEGVVLNVYNNTVSAELFDKNVRKELELETNRVVLRHDEYRIFYHEENPAKATFLNKTWNYGWKKRTS